MSEPTPKLSPDKLLLLQRRLKSAAGAGTGTQTIQPRAQQGPAVLSFAQHQMWLIDQMAPGSAAYNLPIGYLLTGELNPDALEGALNEVIRRHEILRTTFSANDGEAVQVVHPPWQLNLTRIEFGPLSADQRKTALQQYAATEAVRPFDLSKLPLVRVSLVKLSVREYALFINLHHILADGLSIFLLMKELDAGYRAFSRNEKPVFPALSVQYADFAVWERQQATTDERRAQLVFWKDQLKGHLPLLELPWDKPRPAVQSFRGANVFFELSAPLCDRLQAVGTAQECTFFMVVLAAFSAMLHRYSGSTDILIGTPVANRAMTEVQPLIGNFLNILALRCDVSGDPSFNQLLRNTRDCALNAFSHREVPFEQVVEQLHLPRDPGRNPVFQAMLQVLPRSDSSLHDLKISDFRFELGFAQFDFSLHLHEVAAGYHGRLEYCTDLLNRDTVERFAGHFLNFLQGIVAHPEQAVSTIPILSESERRQITVEWNATAVDYPQNICLHHLVEAQVKRTPDAPAVVFENTRLSFRELDAKANQLAHFLQKRGIGADHLVGISTERSLELVIGLMGILKAGAAYVPIDPSYPQNRLAYMLDDSKVKVLLTQQTLLAKLPPHQAETICLDSEWSKIATESTAKPADRANAGNLAYMIYTSGSTGRPKGALNSHRGIVNRLLWMQDEYKLTGADSVMQKTPFSFDVSVWEFFWPLLTGARLVVALPGGHQDPAYLINLICREKITVMHFVPSMLRAFLEAPDVERCTSLREVICSGEALPYDLQESFYSRLSATRLENLYGPTEAAVDVTYWACPRSGDRKIVPIGRPVANTQTYVLDRHLNPVPVGVPGELHLGGIQVGLGYFNQPELTKEKFIPNPFNTEPGARLYKTGDLARYLSDGNIEYLGRIDHQVKIRGLRIELGEIESVLAQHPAVKESVVVARNEGSDVRLVAYLVTAAPAPEPAALREHLKNQLPDYMVPSAFVFLPELPLSSNGKIDRKALPAPGQTREELTAFVAPRNETEAELAAIWAQVLRVPQVGVHDNFFELGGHSLLALRVVSRIRQQLGVDMALSVVFAAPTVEKMAVKLSDIRIANLDADDLAKLLDEIESTPGNGVP